MLPRALLVNKRPVSPSSNSSPAGRHWVAHRAAIVWAAALELYAEDIKEERRDLGARD